MKIEGWADVISSVKTPLSLLALITLGIYYLFSISTLPYIKIFLLVILFIITVACLAFVAKNKMIFPSEIRSIWSENDLPLRQQNADAWLGKWNCHWTYTTKDNELKPYVDDIIEIRQIDPKSGELSGVGFSSYVAGAEYTLKGRVSNKHVAHIFYTSPAETAGLSGMVILSRPPIGRITGWWLGAGRKGGDIGGSVTMQRHEEDEDFIMQNYEVEA